MEKEIQARSKQEQSPGYTYKKRKLNELCYKEVNVILDCYLNEPLT